MAKILIVDDDPMMLRYTRSLLESEGYQVRSASTGADALHEMQIAPLPELVLLDMVMPETDGLETLSSILASSPAAKVVMLSGQHDPAGIVQAMKLGAADYLAKPVDEDRLLEAVRLYASSVVKEEEPELIYEELGTENFFLAASPAMKNIYEQVKRIARVEVPVLITGESGTGKEIIAQLLHKHSARAKKRFLKINCAAIPEELLESELFGYEPGAFTGANRQKLGKFDLAHGGTMFMDEISEMHPALQAKLLHVLQDGEFSRLGGKRDIAVDVRMLAATNKHLERAVEEGTFREDLFYRLNVVTIHIPPLRERREEIPLFLAFFMRKYSEYYGKQPPPFSDYAISRMMDHSWPGNIRELENLVKRYVIVGNEAQIIREFANSKPVIVSGERANAAWEVNGHIMADDRSRQVLPAAPQKAALSATTPGTESLSLLEIGRRAANIAEREAIQRVLNQTRWNRRQAAKILKVSYKALLNKLKAMEEQESGKSGT